MVSQRPSLKRESMRYFETIKMVFRLLVRLPNPNLKVGENEKEGHKASNT